MYDGLLLIERIIIESISKKEKNVYELAHDTNLDQGLLMSVLPNLLMKNLLNYQRGIYSIDKENSLCWQNTINEKNNVKEEVKELFASMVNEYFRNDFKTNEQNSQLKVQKIWLTSDEEKILKGHFLALENFFTGVKQSRSTKPVKERTYEQKVILWGVSEYADLVTSCLDAV